MDFQRRRGYLHIFYFYYPWLSQQICKYKGCIKSVWLSVDIREYAYDRVSPSEVSASNDNTILNTP